MQFGCGSIEGVEELREKSKRTCLLSVRAQAGALAGERRRGRMGGVVASSCSTLTLCQQVQSVIAVSGEGVKLEHQLQTTGFFL